MFLAVAVIGLTSTLVGAQETPPAAATPPATSDDSSAELGRQQQQLSEKYRRFEEVLLRMAELTAPTDPKRAALLRKAVAESKQQLIGLQLDKLVELLNQDRLSVALNSQNDVNKDLAELLELLLTEERDKGIKNERARLKEQIRRVTELINKERQLQGQTSGGGELRELAQGQGKVAEDAAKLAEDMQAPGEDRGKERKPKEHDDSGDENEKPGQPTKSAPSNGDENAGRPGQSGAEKSGEKPQEKSDDAKKPVESKDQPDKDAAPEDDKKADEQKPASESEQGQPSKPGKPQDGQQEGQPGQSGESQEDSQQSEQQQPQDSAESARKRVQAAQQKMDQARQKLEKAQREGAVEEQEAAIRELEQAKAELEEILRQLREEELERMLALLEARFRKMLEAQVEVYEGTKRVDSTPLDERDRNDEIEAGRLSRKESQIVLEAESALAVLREEGSAVAFPEAVEQMREDMDQIVSRLAQTDVGDITQSIEEDVIAALEEMIDSLQKAQQDQEKKQQQQQQQEGEAQEPPLVDTLAELKMIRSLQMRINMRTKRLARLVDGEVGQTDKPEVREQLQRLAEREASIYRVTRDIVTGKNK